MADQVQVPSYQDVERATQEAFVVVCRATLGMVCSYSVLVRRLLAHTLNMVAPDAPVEPPTNREWRIAATNAVHEMYAALGVPIGAAPTHALREQVRQAFDFREPPAPEWVCSGAVVRSILGKERVIEAVCRSDGNAVVQLASRRHGEPGKQIPMGLFLAEYRPTAGHALAVPAVITGTVDAEPTLHFTGTLDDVRGLRGALVSAICTGFGERRNVFGLPQLLFVRKGAIANQPELIPGGYAFVAERDALSDILTVAESLSAAKTRCVIYAKLGSFERVIVEVREEAPPVLSEKPTWSAPTANQIDDLRSMRDDYYTIGGSAPVLSAGLPLVPTTWPTLIAGSSVERTHDGIVAKASEMISHAILGSEIALSAGIGRIVLASDGRRAGKRTRLLHGSAFELIEFVSSVLASLGQVAPVNRIWAHREPGSFAMFVDAAVGDDALRRAEEEARKLVPEGVLLTVERSQMPALRALAVAVEAAVDAAASPRGQRYLAEQHIREDARRWPAFAPARRAVAMAYVEESHIAAAAGVPRLLVWLCEYEDRRGVGREPSRRAVAHARATFGSAFMAVYERARAAHPQPDRLQVPRGEPERRRAILDAFPRPDMSVTSYFTEKSE